MTCSVMEGLLTRHVLGDLDEAQRLKVEAHLIGCASCRQAVESMRPTVDLLRQALTKEAATAPRLDPVRRARVLASYGSPSPRVVWLPRILKAAAAIVVILGFVGLLLPASQMARERARRCQAAAMPPASPARPQGAVYGGIPHPEWHEESSVQADVAGRVVEETRAVAASGPVPSAQPAANRRAARDRDLKQAASAADDRSGGGPGGGAAGEPASGADSYLYKTEDGQKRKAAPQEAATYFTSGTLRYSGGRHGSAAPAAKADAAQPATRQAAGQGGTPAEAPAELRYADSHVDDYAVNGVSAVDGKEAIAFKLAAAKTAASDAARKDAGYMAEPAKPAAALPTVAAAPAPAADLPSAASRLSLETAAGDVRFGLGERGRSAGDRGVVKGVASTSGGALCPSTAATGLAEPSRLLMAQEADGDGRALQLAEAVPQPMAANDESLGRLVDTTRPARRASQVADALDGIAATASSARSSDKTVEREKKQEAAGECLGDRETAMAPSPKPAPASRHRDALQALDAAVEPVYPPQAFNPVVETRQNAFSTFGIDVDTASFTLARRYLLQGQRPPEGAIRVEEFVNAFEYAYRSPERDTFAVYTDRARSPFRPNLQVLRIGVRGKVIGRDRMKPSALTFAIDTSGSMNTPDRMDLIRRSLGLLVDQLGAHDTVSIVAFSSEPRLVLDQAGAGQKAAIRAAIAGLQCSGSTHLEGGIRLAYEVAARNFAGGAINRVLVLSDGVANLGAATAQEILGQVERYRKQGIYCSVFGFGQGNYNDSMLETLADKGDGVYRFIDSAAEARRVFVDDLAANLNTIARDVKIQVEFAPGRVPRYRQIGYENRHLEKEQFRDDAVDAGEVGSGQSATALYEIEETGPAAEPLGTVRLRWKDIDTGRVEERSFPIRASERYASFEAAPARFRLAAGVAELADLLRRSPYSEGTTLRDVGAVLRPVGLELNLDPQVQDVVRMLKGAE